MADVLCSLEPVTGSILVVLISLGEQDLSKLLSSHLATLSMPDIVKTQLRADLYP